MVSKPLHQRLHLHVLGNEEYVLEPVSTGEKSSGRPCLRINRRTGDIGLISSAPREHLASSAHAVSVFGVVGVISLSTSDFLVLITGRERKGVIMGHDVYAATDFEVLPFMPVRATAIPAETHLLALLKSHLNNGNFLFSYTWDITRRLQAQWVARNNDMNRSMWEITDDRFFWNRFLQTRLVEATKLQPDNDLGPYILPIIYGSFAIHSTRLNGRDFQLCLISRRSRYRAGTRYFRRGIDEQGHVANFNETEQIVLLDPSTSYGSNDVREDSAVRLSYVQVRGSVPVFWAEVNTLRYKPDLQVMDAPHTDDALRAHLRELTSLYGDVHLVNLVNQTGYEKPVKEAFERHFTQVAEPHVSYRYFDFHKECRKMRFDKISLLVDCMDKELEAEGYFHFDSAREDQPLKLQLGTVRTNCMDNLDRTNVAQAALAKHALLKQLRALSILRDYETIDAHAEFFALFRTLWADHADAISVAYSGTGALKTDFTRTGQRTQMGNLQDGLNSTMRYIKNNYFDGPRQDAFDIFTGAWVPRKGSPLSSLLLLDNRPLVTQSMPNIFFFSLLMICAGLTLPRQSDLPLRYWFFIWITLFSISLAYIFAYGVDYVAWPRLNPLIDIIYYQGAGYRSGRHGQGIKLLSPSAISIAASRSLNSVRRKTDAVKYLEMAELGKKHID